MEYKIYRVFLTLVSRGVVLTALMPLACFAKAWVAQKLGDRTAAGEGRLSLDFRRHTDWFGMLMVMVIGFGFSREVNIDVARLKNMKRDVTLISLTAPVTYFIMYVLLRNISQLILGISPASFILASVYFVLRKAAFSSLFFGVIALLPIPPLDGFHIFYQFSWPKFRRWYFTNYQKITEWSRFILLAVFFLESVSDGEFSILAPLVYLWRLLLDRLIFFFPDLSDATQTLLREIIYKC
ncbi:MAG: site-2 protease family protein [Ruminococcus sp.]|uniref:site-2 protease family protein n=1 Tax=Ruminococcus sp. TaxID=41978 RepID=UPI0025E24615|nr:site-2 protease family protein [Ruminococcus sp.]MBR5683565.1 site-2 protease family protein [Ruminococcus sp.]